LSRIKDKFGSQMIGHRPTHNTSAKRIEHNSDEQKSSPRRHVRDIRNPELVRPSGGKVPVDKVRSWSRVSISNRRGKAFSPRGALQVSLAHQTSNAAIAHAYFFVRDIVLGDRIEVLHRKSRNNYGLPRLQADPRLASL
jgi:hypothetical protein